MRVVVAGALAAKPRNGGEAWVRLSYLLGLRQLGVDVTFVEQLDDAASPVALAWFESVCDRFGVDAILVDASGRALSGGDLEPADALLNLSGNLRVARLLARCRRRAYIDLDPCFTQIWHASGLVSVAAHHVYYTVGENVGTSRCSVPSDGIRWRATRPPVVLGEWRATGTTEFDRFTTVATWRPDHGSVTVAGTTLGLRVHAFRRVANLPRTASLPFEAALAIHPAERRDLALLRSGGWRLVTPERVAGDPDAYRAYVAGSGAEFSVAQEAYTATRTGWIGDRTVRYLASGRPALVEDTGQTSVPTGAGLLTFSTPSEARSAAHDLVENYAAHRAAALELAVEHFAADKVLSQLLEDLL
jgi:hypothetical protein